MVLRHCVMFVYFKEPKTRRLNFLFNLIEVSMTLMMEMLTIEVIVCFRLFNLYKFSFTRNRLSTSPQVQNIMSTKLAKS